MQSVKLETSEHMPTVDIGMLKMAAGFQREFGRNTASRIFAVIHGEGSAHIGELDVSWTGGDVFAVPSWQPYTLCASTEAVLFEVSDAPVLQKLGFYRTL
jgi:gentisate 1,2-dioxygenase